jgi:purine-cytosine permease-like protein
MIALGVGGLGVGGGTYPPPWLGVIGGIAFIAFLVYAGHRSWHVMTGYALVGFFALFFMAALLVFDGVRRLLHI